MLRVAGGASGVLVGVYIADLADRGLPMGAGLVGTLAAISFGATRKRCSSAGYACNPKTWSAITAPAAKSTGRYPGR